MPQMILEPPLELSHSRISGSKKPEGVCYLKNSLINSICSQLCSVTGRWSGHSEAPGAVYFKDWAMGGFIEISESGFGLGS